MKVNDFIKKYEHIWDKNPKGLLEKYDYQKKLTDELDQLKPAHVDFETIFKIVLWKVNRFPYINEDQIKKLKKVSNFTEHKQAEALIKELLMIEGIALPMASTILRFINPNVFQIIDERAYRVLFPDQKKYPSKPQKITDGYLNNSIAIYFAYLDKLHEICDEKLLPFKFADRILYELDKELGHTIGKKKKT